ncbi:hypothetical protein H5410_038215 [Solanum commersonii]|uniref:Uncharacterized protein n=1 Tax=Solanum commersonii TaxID=4109 RepID=A0A9J5YAP2_SOLCO|nr:hypothetical protein H5410_038215 [Solanum commersonii]
MVRTPCRDENGRKKGTWTPEEDRKLAAYITKYGSWNWRQLPKYAGLARCGKSCRLRWMNYLRPNVKRGNYTKEEDEIILNLHAQLGNKWSAIAVHLPGRSDNEIKNHWHTTLKKRANYNLSEGSKKCNNKKSESNITTRKSNVENQNASANNNNNMHENIVLESSEWSPKESSSEELSSIDYQQDIFHEEFGNLEEITSGSFWTEPFEVDSKIDFVAPSIDYCGLVCPPSPFMPHEFFHFDDCNNYW